MCTSYMSNMIYIEIYVDIYIYVHIYRERCFFKCMISYTVYDTLHKVNSEILRTFTSN